MIDYTALAQQLENAGIEVRGNESLARYTTFQIGGPATLFCVPHGLAQLAQAYRICRTAGSKAYLLGKGSNTLFADEGFDGVVIFVGRGLDEIELTGPTTIRAGAGAALSHLCLFAAKHSLSGLEFAYGIPGSVGGAVYMNAGAYCGEMKDVLCRVGCVTAQGEEQVLEVPQMNFGYRTSLFEQQGGAVLWAEFSLQPADGQAVRTRMKELLSRRTARQPLEMPSAGSTFKRPHGAYAAALIEECGLKGFRIGNAAISEKHSGFVINLGGATAKDVLAVAEEVARIVKEKTGHQLEKEVRVVR